MLLISRIELPKDQDGDAFAEFMREEYIPAVHTGPTRVGQVEGVELLERDTTEDEHEFLWLVHFDGLKPRDATVRVDDDAVREKFESFAPTLTQPDTWQEVARL